MSRFGVLERRMGGFLRDKANKWRNTTTFVLLRMTRCGSMTSMPSLGGTPAEIQATVRRHLQLAGPRGGLFCCPTHMLEPEVPWENLEAYVAACREWKP